MAASDSQNPIIDGGITATTRPSYHPLERPSLFQTILVAYHVD